MTTGSEQGHSSHAYKESAAHVADALERANPKAARLRHGIFRLAREYEASTGHTLSIIELRDEIKRRYDPKTGLLKLDFTLSAKPLGYMAAFSALVGTQKDTSIIDYLQGHREALLGMRKITSAYLAKPQTDEGLRKRLEEIIRFGMIPQVEAFLEEMDAKPGETLLYGRNKLLMVMECYAHHYEQYAILEAIQAKMPAFLTMDRGLLAKEKTPERQTYHEIRRANPHLTAREISGLELIFNAELPAAFNLETYRHNRSEMAHEYHNVRSLNIVAAMMTLLMPERDAAMKYFREWGSWLKNPAGHPLTQCLRYVAAQPYDPEINYKAWGDGLMHYGPRFAFYFGYAAKLKEPILDKSGKPLLKKTREALMSDAYREGASDPELAQFCFQRAIPEKDFNTAAELMRRYHDPDASPADIPDYTISGEKFGLPGTQLSRLHYDDPRLLFIGTYTGCCEYVGSTCDDTITHAVSTRRSTFYAITDIKSGTILAHSWVWMSPTQYLVFDGFETISPRITDKVIVDAVSFFATSLKQQRICESGFPDIRAVALGKCSKNIPATVSLPPTMAGDILPLTPFRDLALEDRALLHKPDKLRMGDSSEFRLIRSLETPLTPLLLRAP